MGLKSKINGAKGETAVSRALSSRGYWVHVIKRDRQGSQPCDIIASKGTYARGDVTWLVDAKYVETGDRFDFSDVQPNQPEAMEYALGRCRLANVGFAIVFGEQIRFMPYHLYESLSEQGAKSVKAEELPTFEMLLNAVEG